MAKRKLQRFAETSSFGNVFQRDCGLSGRWNADYFHNTHPLVLELGCGRGEYTVNLARRNPGANFIGVDIKGARLWRGAKTALQEGLSNVAFLRTQIETIEDYFSPGEVSEIWITFPDPQPQHGRSRKRLTSPRFLNYYHSILRPGGRIHLKTDNKGLYEYTLQMTERHGLTLHDHTSDLYESRLLNETLSIRTTYESVYLEKGQKIRYLCFSLPETYTPVDWKEDHRQWTQELQNENH